MDQTIPHEVRRGLGLDQSVSLDPVKPAAALTDLQRRLESELDMHLEITAKRRNGGPEELGEIDRELLILSGALEGLGQRVGALAATLGPVLPGDIHAHLMQPQADPDDGFMVATEVGQRIATIRRAVTQTEHVLSVLLNSVRL